MKPRLLAILLSVLTLVVMGTAVIAQGTVTVLVGDVQAVHGEDVEIHIEVKDASGVGAMHVEMSYDPAVLSPIRGVELGDLASGGLVVGNTDSPGIVTIAIAHPTGFSGDGVVAKVMARAAGSDGASTDLGLENVTVHHYQTKALVPSTVSNGSFTEGSEGGGSSLPVWGLFGLLAVVVVGAGAYAFTRRTTSRRATAPQAAAGWGLMVAGGSALTSYLALSQPVTTIGRSSGNTLVLDDEQASREHARIVSGAGGHTLYDLGSANGTFVNGQQVTQQVLRAGDRITLGSTTLTVQQR